jgi:hypothetical protein
MTNLPANTLSVVAMNRRPGRRAHSRRSADAAVQIMGRRTTLIAAETVGRTSLNTDGRRNRSGKMRASANKL